MLAWFLESANQYITKKALKPKTILSMSQSELVYSSLIVHIFENDRQNINRNKIVKKFPLKSCFHYDWMILLCQIFLTLNMCRAPSYELITILRSDKVVLKSKFVTIGIVQCFSTFFGSRHPFEIKKCLHPYLVCKNVIQL